VQGGPAEARTAMPGMPRIAEESKEARPPEAVLEVELAACCTLESRIEGCMETQVPGEHMARLIVAEGVRTERMKEAAASICLSKVEPGRLATCTAKPPNQDAKEAAGALLAAAASRMSGMWVYRVHQLAKARTAM
jgi:hypothetical protein